MNKHDDDDGFRSTEEAYHAGQTDAASVQRHMTPEHPASEIWLSPEDAMSDMEKSADDEMMQAYYRGYLSRWD